MEALRSGELSAREGVEVRWVVPQGADVEVAAALAADLARGVWALKSRALATHLVEVLRRRAQISRRPLKEAPSGEPDPNRCLRLQVTEESFEWVALYQIQNAAGGGFGPPQFLSWTPWQTEGLWAEPVRFVEAMTTVQEAFNEAMRLHTPAPTAPPAQSPDLPSRSRGVRP